jgi:hypothetical protein
LARAVIFILTTRRPEGGIDERWIKGEGIKRKGVSREALK